MRIAVYGLWHLGPVTAACLADAGHTVVGIDDDEPTLAGLRAGRAPVSEPGLDELLERGTATGRLSFAPTRAAAAALERSEVLWVTFDTPVDEEDRADVASVRRNLERLRSDIAEGTRIVLSAQIPVGFARRLAEDWRDRSVRVAVVPENLRLGRALESFRHAERTVVGLQEASERDFLEALLAPFASRIEWMSLESAEMAKHALNAFLATSVAFINEVARLCETTGANAKDVERALKSEPRIGPRSYLGPGAAFAGGTLGRDLRYLQEIGSAAGVETPLVDGVYRSNSHHARWLCDRVLGQLAGVADPVVALLGLVYTPGTNTLRRSGSVALARQLAGAGVRVQAHDPAVTATPVELEGTATVLSSAREALRGADVAVIATAWQEYRSLRPADFTQCMRRACVVDERWFLAAELSHAPELIYLAPGFGGRT